MVQGGGFVQIDRIDSALLGIAYEKDLQKRAYSEPSANLVYNLDK